MAAATDEVIIAGASITKRYGTNLVLDSTDFVVRSGVTGLLGSNGAGKTTMLGLLLGLNRRDAGSLSVLGHDPQTAGAEVRSRIGYSPEHHNLPPDLPATDFVRHIAEVHGIPATEAVGRASDALWFVGMGEERLRPLGTMSTGQRQRVKLAMAIAHDPDLVMLDEPTDGLDPTQREVMLDLIRRLASEFSMNVLLSSHLLDEVERTCNDVVILSNGRVGISGALDEIRGTGRGVTVTVDAGAAELAAALSRRGCEVELDQGRLVVTFQDGAPPANGAASGAAVQDPQGALLRLVRDEVAELGVPMRRLQARTVSLEEVFLSVGT